MREQKQGEVKKKRGLPARLILWGMGFLSFFRLPKRLVEEHLSHNRRVWDEYLAKRKEIASERSVSERNTPERALLKNDTPETTVTEQKKTEQAEKGKLPFIEDQNRLTDFLYGRERKWLGKKLLGGRMLCAAENACEVIAVYNALLALGQQPDFPELLGRFERRGISLLGYFGTSFKGVWRYFAKSPYALRVLRGGQITKEVLAAAQQEGYRVCVMMAENKAGDLKEMVHTICITQKDAATWTAHNDYEGSKTYADLSDAVFGYHKGGGRPLGVLLLKNNQTDQKIDL